MTDRKRREEEERRRRDNVNRNTSSSSFDSATFVATTSAYEPTVSDYGNSDSGAVSASFD